MRIFPNEAYETAIHRLPPLENPQYPISNLSSPLPCRIHNGGMPQSDPTLAVCLDAERLDLGRVGITPDPLRLSTSTAKAIAMLLK